MKKLGDLGPEKTFNHRLHKGSSKRDSGNKTLLSSVKNFLSTVVNYNLTPGSTYGRAQRDTGNKTL